MVERPIQVAFLIDVRISVTATATSTTKKNTETRTRLLGSLACPPWHRRVGGVPLDQACTTSRRTDGNKPVGVLHHLHSRWRRRTVRAPPARARIAPSVPCARCHCHDTMPYNVAVLPAWVDVFKIPVMPGHFIEPRNVRSRCRSSKFYRVYSPNCRHTLVTHIALLTMPQHNALLTRRLSPAQCYPHPKALPHPKASLTPVRSTPPHDSPHPKDLHAKQL